MSDSLWPHESKHTRPPCPSPTPRAYSNSSPSSWWCHPAISSSFVPFSSCPQSLPASGSFPMSQLFESGGQSIGVLASASVLPMNTQVLANKLIPWKNVAWSYVYKCLNICVWMYDSMCPFVQGQVLCMGLVCACVCVYVCVSVGQSDLNSHTGWATWVAELLSGFWGIFCAKDGNNYNS